MNQWMHLSQISSRVPKTTFHAVLTLLLLSTHAFATTGNCSDGVDNDGDGGVDALVELDPNNGETYTVGTNFDSIYSSTKERAPQLFTHTSCPLSGGGSAMLLSFNAPWTTGSVCATPASQSQLHLTVTKICNLAGYLEPYSWDSYYPGDGGRCNWYSPGDDCLWYWNGSRFSYVDGNPKYTKRWLTGLECRHRLPACGDGQDNDGDGRIDYSDDSGCASANDDDERPHDVHCTNITDNKEASDCSDGVDNDGDGAVDLTDPGCANVSDDSEKNPNGPECDDGVDNDGDGRIDFVSGGQYDVGDLDCSSPADLTERMPLPVALIIVQNQTVPVNTLVNLSTALWHKVSLPVDVNNDGAVSLIDSLQIINHLNAYGVHTLPAPSPGNSPPPSLDVNGDNVVSEDDVLQIINVLNGGTASKASWKWSIELVNGSTSINVTPPVNAGQNVSFTPTVVTATEPNLYYRINLTVTYALSGATTGSLMIEASGVDLGLPAPEPVILFNANGSITLSWAAVPGASSYSVYAVDSCAGLGGSFTRIQSSVASTSWIDVNAAAYPERYYKVSAVRGIIENVSSYIVGKFDMDLTVGWNLASVPLIPTNPSIKPYASSVFASLHNPSDSDFNPSFNGSYDFVVAPVADGSTVLGSFDPRVPSFLDQNVRSISEKVAFQIRMLRDDVLTVVGRVPVSSSIGLSGPYWFWIGYPSCKVRSIKPFSSSVLWSLHDGVVQDFGPQFDGRYYFVVGPFNGYSFLGTFDPFKPSVLPQNLDSFSPSRGYIIHMKRAGTLNIAFN